MSAKFIVLKSDGVRLDAARAYLAAEAFLALALHAPELCGDSVTITSANDSSHKKGSLHYVGAAWDVRTHPTFDAEGSEIPRHGAIMAASELDRDESAQFWADQVGKFLGDRWDVIYERKGRHIHVEYDP